MTLSPGTRLGPYEVVAPLGAGGMGEVWKARDPRLRRDVAVKVLPSEVAADPGRLARFLDEARAASALNHPGILTVHDFGNEDGVAYLVTELLEGQTLREALGGAVFPPRRVAEIAIQIARALAAAHARGIVHRDLKPENLFLTGPKSVKVLDWGLARQVDAPRGAPGVTEVPTRSLRTEPGTVLGTVGYMAPEQVRGEPADSRSDIFAFGCVLYEMLAGRRAFARPTSIQTMSAILADEPPPLPWSGALPSALGLVAQRCLEKQPAERFQSAQDLAFALEALAGASAAAPSETPAGKARPVRRTFVAAGLVAAATLLAGFLLRAGFSSPAPSSVPDPGSLEPLTTDPGYEGDPTFSPDGQTIAYVSDRDGNFEIYLQQVAGGPAINLTRDRADDVQPAFSPDGRQIAFVSSRGGATDVIKPSPGMPPVGGDIWVMPALGGPARKIAENGNYPSWSPDGETLAFTHGTFRQSRIALVPATGGASRDLPLTGVTDARLCWPSFSGDGRWILFQNGLEVRVVPAAGGTARVLARGEHPAWGPGSASLLYTNLERGRGGTLWRAPFSSESGALAGPARPLTFGPGVQLGPAISRDGRTVVFAAVDESGNVEELPFDLESGRATGPSRALTAGNNRIGLAHPSPDGSAVVFAATRGESSHIWRVDPPAPPVQLTFDRKARDIAPRWSPDGGSVAFVRHLEGDPADVSAIWVMRPDGAGARRVAEAGRDQCWLRDSRRMLVQRGESLHVVDVASGAETSLPGIAARTLFTPDPSETWLAVQTVTRGNIDIEAVPFAGGPPRIVVQTRREDYHPFFSPSGRWLYYLADHKNFWRVPGPAQGWRAASPEKVTDFPEAGLYLEDPHPSRDGRSIFFTRNRTVADLWILRTTDAGAARP